MKINELKRNLSELSKDELINDIVDLFKKNEFVKDYYYSRYREEDIESLIVKYKKVIKNEFFPERGEPQLRYSVARKAISEFVKISSDKRLIAELMIYYVENGVNFTNEYGDIDERFYMSIESMFEKAALFIEKNNLISEFHDRCKKFVTDTEGIGWGFHDELYDIFYSHIHNE